MDINSYISSGIIETYVMGLCNAEEKSEMESLRRQYPELNEAVLQYETALESNLLKNATMPGDAVDEKVLKSLRALQTPVVNIATGELKQKKTGWLKFVAAAAVLLLAISSVFNFMLYSKNSQQELVLKQKENYSPLPLDNYNILKQQTITPVAMYGVSSHSICRCTIFWDKAAGKAFIMIHHLPQVSQNNYQLWAIVDGKPVSVGIINDDIRDRFIEMSNVPLGATSFIVTLEKAGGTTTPTMEETYLSGSI